MIFVSRIWLVFLLLFSIKSYAQITDYTIKDTTVFDCKAFLHDDNWPGPQYEINQSYCFNIDVGTGSVITISFSEFNTETNADQLTIYDQLGCTGNTLLNQWSGDDPPSPISSPTGFMSFYWDSDIAVAESGFDGYWTTLVPPPIPPDINTVIPTCNSNTLILDLTSNVVCDSVISSNFILTSESSNYTITNAVPVTCNADSTNKIRLTLGSEIDVNCEYQITWNLKLADRCDSIYEFIVQDTFMVLACPFDLTIEADSDTICPGVCTDIEAVILTDCINFNYTWIPALPTGPGPHTICPTTTTTYQVTAVDTDGLGISETAQITIYIADPDISTPDTTVCQKANEFNIVASPLGGYFEGNGILDSLAGLFHPDTAGPGNHKIYYNIGALCKDSLTIFVDSIEAGDHEAACKNTAPFNVVGYYPVDGTWSGDFITPDGVFTPPNVTDSIEVTYTATATGCSHTKYIYIDSLITIVPFPDSICESMAPFNIDFSPPGGVWSGPGIEDSLEGFFSPRGANFGHKVLVYDLHGCSDTVKFYINEIDIGEEITTCPFQDPFQLSGSPVANTVWSGDGPGITTGGWFDPSLVNNGTNGDRRVYYKDTITGCVDSKKIYVRNTKLTKDSLYFCENDPALKLNKETTGRTPGGNYWTGVGVEYNNPDYFFNPIASGIGIFVVTYTVNTCSDSLYAIVYPENLILEDTLTCSSQDPFLLDSLLPPGGTWTGSGIIDNATGLFDPGSAISDTFYVYYKTPSSCKDSILIINYTFVEANLSSISENYCWVNNDNTFNRVPANATIIGAGITGSTFNPTIAGAGTHLITSSFGVGSCLTTDTISVNITPAIETSVTISKDTICNGQASKITVIASGGNPANSYSYNWSDNLFAIYSNTVTPINSTSYVVTTSDGCSDPVNDTATIYIVPTFSVEVLTSPQLCYGDTGWALASVTGSSIYSYSWSTSPTQITEQIIANAGDFINLTVTEDILGCEFDTLIKVPNFKPIKALFSVNPNEECIPFSQKENIELIDLSSNAVSGVWSFSDGSSRFYELGESPQVPFNVPGLYSVLLEVENEGGCKDSMSLVICVDDEVDIFIASAFSPNNDGLNDFLIVRSSTIDELEFYVYDRWGEKVFFSDNITDGWDGQFRGEPAIAGVYTYYAKITYVDGKKELLKGDILLVR